MKKALGWALLAVGLIAIGFGIYSYLKPASPKHVTPYCKVSKRIQVPANQIWFDTGVDVTGKAVCIQYETGMWTSGGDDPKYSDGNTGTSPWPGLLVPDLPIRALVGKTDAGPFFVGNHKEGDLGSGHLYLCMNDVPGRYEDNTGSITVSIGFFE
jgi:hypothetical protein